MVRVSKAMGGGGAVRAAAKVAGIGVISGGIRGVPALPPAEQWVRNTSRPVSAILSSSSAEAVKASSGDASAAHNPAVCTQSVVASIACDPNVWNAMLDNPVLKHFMQSQQRNEEMQSHKEFEKSSESSQTGSSKKVPWDFMDMMQNINLTVVEMVSNVSNYLQNIFGFSSAESDSSNANGNTRTITMGSFMGLALLVVMVVVLKRR